MKQTSLIYAVMLLSVTWTIAQSDFKPGFVVKHNQDTLFGEIDYRGDLMMSQICRFKSDGQIEKYTPTDIREYRFTDSKYFVARELNGTKVFLEFLIKGRVNMFYLRDEAGDHYYLEKEGEEIVELPYEEGMRRKNNKSYMYRSTKHMGLLNYYMQDAPGFQSRISKIKKPDQQKLVELAEDYHNVVCKDEACIIYEKPAPWLQVIMEVQGGYLNYKVDGNYIDKNYFQAGVLGHFWMPRSNEKMYFRTGILFSTFERGDENVSTYKIPVQVEYIYPKGILRPKLAYGISLYQPADQTVTITAGLNIHFNDNLGIGVNYDADFTATNLVIFPKKGYSDSFMGGLLFRF